jgi:hypothetical protein
VNVSGSTFGAGIRTGVSSSSGAYGIHTHVSTTGAATTYGVHTDNLTPAGNPFPQYGVYGTAAVSSIGAGLYAGGAGTAGPGVPNAAALEINNGAINITGPAQAAGAVLATMPAGKQQCVVTIVNPLVTPTSRILVTVRDMNGVATGTIVRVFAATVSAQAAGTFDVNYFAIAPVPVALTCTGTPVAAGVNIQINYLIIGP